MIIQLYGPLRVAAGAAEIELRLEGRRRLREVLADLPRNIRDAVVGEDGTPRPGLLIMVNDVDARSVYNYELYVEDTDKITIIPMIHGGNAEPFGPPVHPG